MYADQIDLGVEYMKPIVKYQGGKSKELVLIKQLLPDAFERVLEPFAGGAAVSFALNRTSVLGDINAALMNMYREVKDPIQFQEVFSHVCYLKTLDHDALEKEYYESRDYINGDERDPYKRGSLHNKIGMTIMWTYYVIFASMVIRLIWVLNT